MAKVEPLTIQIFICGDVERRMLDALAWECEQEDIRREHEMDLDDAAEFQHHDIEFCDLRENVDPYWVVNWREEAERDPALVYE